jgi:hypothetical protein
MDVNRLGYFITDIGRNCQIPAFEKPTIIVLKPKQIIVILHDAQRQQWLYFNNPLEVIAAQRIEDVPPELRNINEPLESVLASYTPAEMEALLTRSPFRQWKINVSMAWLFIWGSES